MDHTQFLFGTLTPFQKDMHSFREDRDLISPYFNETKNITWSVKRKIKAPSKVNQEKVQYDISNTLHFLKSTYLRCTYDEVEVKPDYQDRVEICYTPNIGTNRILEGTFKVGEIPWWSIDAPTCDAFFQYFSKPNFRESHEKNVGNTPRLLDWTMNLPAFVTIVKQPFPYCFPNGYPFPLHFAHDSMLTFSHEYKFRNSLKDVLRMRFRKTIDDPWEVLEEPLLRYLNIRGSPTGELALPEIWNTYGYVSKEELQESMFVSVLKEVEGKQEMVKVPREEIEIYYRSWLKFDSVNPVEEGSRATLSLQGKPPTGLITWFAENYQARQTKCFSNYTTNPEEHDQGHNPCIRNTMRYGGVTDFEDYPPDLFGPPEEEDQLCPPYKPGYNCLSYAYDIASGNTDVGIVMSQVGAELDILLGEKNIAPQTIEEEPDILAETASPAKLPSRK